MSDRKLTDDPSIAGTADLWRRVPPWHIVDDHNTGGKRISKAAFDDSDDGSPMSVFLAELVLQSARTPQHILVGYDGFSLVAISAGLVRSKQQGVVRDPIPGEPAHALVFGKKTDSVRRALARGSKWIVGPPGAPKSSH